MSSHLRAQWREAAGSSTVTVERFHDPFIRDGATIRLGDDYLIYSMQDASGSLMGYMRLRQRLSDGVWEVWRVAVEPEYQRQGVATSLLERARADLGRVDHSPERERTPDGRAWSEKVASMMTLYHFTDEWHLADIARSGQIRVTESNVQPSGAGPRVVWLTDDPNPMSHRSWAGGEGKTQFRFTVKVPNPVAWSAFFESNGGEQWWYDALDATGGGGSDHWYVSTSPIPRADWVKLDDLVEGDVVWEAGT